ncbi:MAG: DUF6531 domain-containing protein, partial [Xanthomonadaceae bacterium]|nr:DUF6531 domain-containing protein [Xanthomonadaceae bacterium]
MQTEAKLDLMLGEGKRLRLAEDGTSLSVQSDAGSRVVAHHAISPARMGASLTRLPSGRILVWGGRDARGSVRSGGLLFDLERNVLVPFDIPGLSSRAGNAVTVLTDGRVLFVGDGARGAELWDEDSGKMRKLPVPDDMTRTRFASELQADGRVLLTPHNDTAPGRNDRFLFDPERDIFLRESDDRPGSMMASATTIAESIPAQKATGVDASAPLAIRFTHVADINTLTPAQITLVGPSGATSLKVVPAEQGRLIFIRPSQPLFPGARYTLFVNGVGTDDGQRLAMTAIDFQTASMGVPVPVVSGLTAPVISTGDLPAERCTGPNGHAFPCREHSTLREGVWTPGRDNMGARWRLPGSQPIPTHHGLRSMWLEALGWRVLTGRVLRVDGVPVARVEVNVGDVRGYTDDDGNFTLYGVPMGHQEIYVDGSTANRPGFEYGQFVIGVDVAEKGLTDLSHVMYLPRISARDKVKISSPLRQDVVVTHPDMPGLMIEIPANTVIRDRKGRLVDELAIVPTPVNRAPFPVADNYPMYFTLEPGGAIVQPLTPDGARGIRVFYPNYDDHPVGTEASFWIYDPVDGWRVYGQGHVTADGGMFAPDPGVALHETMGGSYSVNNASPANQEGAPDQQPCGPGCPAGGVSAIAGDPVELKTGAFYYNEADIVIQDIVPLQLERSYSTYDPASHEFGVGTRASYGYTLSLDSASGVLSLILPNGAPIKFERTSGSGANGAWEQRGSAISALSGAVIQVITDNGHKYRMTLRDGSLMQFSSYAPNYLLWTQDRYGNRINYEYDAGLVSRIVSPVGRYIAFEYDGNKRIKTAKDHTGRIWQYRYDVQGMLSEVIYPDRTSRQYRYDVKPKLRATWGRNTVTGKRMLTVMADNASRIHRLTSIVDQRGHTIFENTYDPDFDPVAGGDPAIVDYRQYWRVFSQKQADGSLLHFDYEVDADFLTTQTTVTYPDGSIRRVEFAPDSAYPLQDTSGTGAAQRIYRFERDSANRVTARIDPLGRRTEYERDAMGRITRTTVMPGTQDERTVRVEYNAEGDPVRIIDPLGRITRMEYWNGCPIRVTNSLGQITRYGCNVAGQVVSMTSPSGDTTTLEYWGYDLSRITNSRGKSIQFRYDVLGRLIAAEDPQGRIARQAYDLMDRVDHQIDPSGNMTEFGYDANGNLLAVLLPHGNGVTYQYDARNRLIHRADSLNQAESWSYDPMDRVSTYTDRMNRVTRYAYNAHGERIETVYPDAVVEQADYDQGGRLRALTSSESGRLEWQYDVLNQLTAAINPQGRIDYEYDLVGRRIGMTPASQARVEYRYDQGDRLTRLLQGNETVQFDYDIGNRLTRMVLPNGVKTDYRYDALGQLTDYLWNKADGSSLGGMALEYDEAGRIVAQSGTNGFSPETLPTSSQNNQFDDNNRQMQFNGQSLSYDANGNLV